MKTDDAAESEGKALNRSFKMPRPKRSGGPVLTQRIGEKDSRRHRASMTESLFKRFDFGLNAGLSPALLAYMNATNSTPDGTCPAGCDEDSETVSPG